MGFCRPRQLTCQYPPAYTFRIYGRPAIFRIRKIYFSGIRQLRNCYCTTKGGEHKFERISHFIFLVRHSSRHRSCYIPYFNILPLLKAPDLTLSQLQIIQKLQDSCTGFSRCFLLNPMTNSRNKNYISQVINHLIQGAGELFFASTPDNPILLTCDK